MSYIRLFAVGMASVAIAQSFNAMAGGLLKGFALPANPRIGCRPWTESGHGSAQRRGSRRASQSVGISDNSGWRNRLISTV